MCNSKKKIHNFRISKQLIQIQREGCQKPSIIFLMNSWEFTDKKKETLEGYDHFKSITIMRPSKIQHKVESEI